MGTHAKNAARGRVFGDGGMFLRYRGRLPFCAVGADAHSAAVGGSAALRMRHTPCGCIRPRWHWVEGIGNSEEVRSVVCLRHGLKYPLRRGVGRPEAVPYRSRSAARTSVGGGVLDAPLLAPSILLQTALNRALRREDSFRHGFAVPPPSKRETRARCGAGSGRSMSAPTALYGSRCGIRGGVGAPRPTQNWDLGATAFPTA